MALKYDITAIILVGLLVAAAFWPRSGKGKENISSTPTSPTSTVVYPNTPPVAPDSAGLYDIYADHWVDLPVTDPTKGWATVLQDGDTIEERAIDGNKTSEPVKCHSGDKVVFKKGPRVQVRLIETEKIKSAMKWWEY